MRTLKIASLMAAALLASACLNSGTVSQAEYDQLLQEYSDLQAGAEATRAEYAAQAAVIEHMGQLGADPVPEAHAIEEPG